MADELTPSGPNLAPTSGVNVNLVSWFFLMVSVLAISARIMVKWSSCRRFHGDDILALLALVLSVGSGVTVSLQVSYGLGRSVKSLDEGRLKGFMKCSYAMSLLHLAALLSAKLSIVLLLRIFSPSTAHRRLCLIIGCFMVGWIMVGWIMVSGFLSTFQCNAPKIWNIAGKNCIDRAGLWYSIGALNILTELALICWPIFIIHGLEMKRYKKWKVIGSFGARIIDVGVVAIQLLHTSALNSTDIPLDLGPWVLVTQVVQCVTITTSCIPYLLQLLESLPSGMFLSDELRRRELRDTGNAGEGRKWSAGVNVAAVTHIG